MADAESYAQERELRMLQDSIRLGLEQLTATRIPKIKELIGKITLLLTGDPPPSDEVKAQLEGQKTKLDAVLRNTEKRVRQLEADDRRIISMLEELARPIPEGKTKKELRDLARGRQQTIEEIKRERRSIADQSRFQEQEIGASQSLISRITPSTTPTGGGVPIYISTGAGTIVASATPAPTPTTPVAAGTAPPTPTTPTAGGTPAPTTPTPVAGGTPATAGFSIAALLAPLTKFNTDIGNAIASLTKLKNSSFSLQQAFMGGIGGGGGGGTPPGGTPPSPPSGGAPGDDDDKRKASREWSKAMSGLTESLGPAGSIISTFLNGIKQGSSSLSRTTDILKILVKELDKIITDIRRVQLDLGTTAGTVVSTKFSDMFERMANAFTFAGPQFDRRRQEAVRESYRANFGGVLTAEATADLAKRGLREGLSPEEMLKSRLAFMTLAMGDLNKATTKEREFTDYFMSRGLTYKDAAEVTMKYTDIMARNGFRFQESFMRAAADAKKIGIDLNKVDQVGDNIIGNFENFLEKSAELGAMGFGFDVTRLSELAEYGDTGALFDELRSQLAMTGKDLTKLRRSEQLALSEMFGMSMAEFQRMAGISPETGAGGERIKTGEELQAEANGMMTQLVDVGSNLVYILKNLILPALVIAGAGSAFKAAGAAITGVAPVLGKILNGLGTIGPMLGNITMGAAGMAIGVGSGTAIARGMGTSNTAGLVGSGIGSVVGGIAGQFLIPIPGVGFMIGSALGGLAGGAIAGAVAGDDAVSKSGYGQRTLVTPTNVIALNNEDNVIAYANDLVNTEDKIQMLSKGALGKEITQQPSPEIKIDLSGLEARFDSMISAIASMKIDMDATRVGNVLVRNSESVTSVGVLRKPTNTY